MRPGLQDSPTPKSALSLELSTKKGLIFGESSFSSTSLILMTRGISLEFYLGVLQELFCGKIILRVESLILVCMVAFMLAQVLALLTIYSRIEGYSSSSSGLHRISPIYWRVSPASAPIFKRVEEILMFLKHLGRNLKVFSSFLISAMISMFLMYSSDLLEKGISA